MTAEWENKLSQIEHEQYTSEQFMQENFPDDNRFKPTTMKIVEGADALMKRSNVIGACPHCGSEVVSKDIGWACRNRECRFVLWKNSAYFRKIEKPMTEYMAAKLLREKRVRLKDCKSSRTGKVFTADVLMDIEEDGKPVFPNEFPNSGSRK